MTTPQEELENYRYQLAQVQENLGRDPSNQELLRLQVDLKELITLTESLLGNDDDKVERKKASRIAAAGDSTKHQSSAKAAKTENSSALDGIPMLRFQPGDMVEAKWSGDGRYYEARIEAVDIDGNYTVSFTSYGTTEFVSPDFVRAVNIDDVAAAAAASKKRALDSKTVNASATGTVVRKRKKQTLEEHFAKKEKEQADKQTGWLNFNAKLSSGKVKRPAINKKSIFATSQNPNAKVGVTGSGKGMTQYQPSKATGNNRPPPSFP